MRDHINGMFYEGQVLSERAYANPLHDVTVHVDLVGPGGVECRIGAFWDGGRIWRFRFWHEIAGEWRYKVSCPEAPDDFAGGREGRFLLQPGMPAPLQLSADRTYLVDGDGAPFFWLADTVWNGLLKATGDDWHRYLATRKQQGFTVIQAVLTDWRGCLADLEGETAFSGKSEIAINPSFYRRIDAKVAAIRWHGLVPCLTMLWALTPRDPGSYLPEADAIRLAEYLRNRYGAYNPVWFLGGDGRYFEDLERWKRIGRAVFGSDHKQLVTLHPCGRSWLGNDLREEPWYDFVGYQSSHSLDSSNRWIVEGPPAKEWHRAPMLPVINLEPCYEAHLARPTDRNWTVEEVRWALYQSLLASPTAGVTYGHHAIWPWSLQREVPCGHLGTGIPPLWYEALETEGTETVRHLANFFASLDWWRLRPAHELLARQPGEEDYTRHIAASLATDGSFAVLYLPHGGTVALAPDRLWQPCVSRWFNPRTGEWLAPVTHAVAPQELTAPGEGDWLLVIANRLAEC